MTYLVFLAYEVKENAEWAKKKLEEIYLDPDMTWVLQEEWLSLVKSCNADKQTESKSQ